MFFALQRGTRIDVCVWICVCALYVCCCKIILRKVFFGRSIKNTGNLIAKNKFVLVMRLSMMFGFYTRYPNRFLQTDMSTDEH